jgi:flagellar L-ring protein FlgH
MRFFTRILIFIFSFMTIAASADSLWNDNSANIYSNKIKFAVGDTIQILVDEQSVIDYKSDNKTVKSYDINIQGGELTAILNFVPKGNVQESGSAQNKDNLKIQTTIQGRITRIGNNTVTITGSKNLVVNNKSNFVTITGDASFSDVTAKSVLSSKLIDPQISITSLIDNKNQIINTNDIETVTLNPDSTSDKKQETRLKDAKKKELLLNYFNKILNVIF